MGRKLSPLPVFCRTVERLVFHFDLGSAKTGFHDAGERGIGIGYAMERAGADTQELFAAGIYFGDGCGVVELLEVILLYGGVI